DNILDFWFGELKPAQWYKADPTLDSEIARRFGSLHETLCRHVADDWRNNARGALAAVIVLDQFSRNVYRGTPRAFAADPAALRLASETIDQGLDKGLAVVERQFLYMPFEHAEDRAVQARSIALFENLGDAYLMKYARAHHDIVERFGRF